MDIFFTLLTNMIPLYALIVLGYVAGRFCNVDRASVGNLVVFIFMPLTVFGFVTKMEFQAAYIYLPFIVFTILSVIALTALQIGKKIYPDGRANLLALCSAWGNTGYFALPLILLFFTPAQVAIYMFMMGGGLLFEATIGYYILSRGKLNVRDSLLRLAKFPSLYSLILGLAVNLSGFEAPDMLDSSFESFKGGYVTLGMMIIGVAISKVEKLCVSARFVSLSFIGKFICWPLLAWGFVLFDRHVLGLYGADIHQLLMIMAIVPQGANIAAFASQLNLNPEKAATTILIGTCFALVYVPFMFMVLGVQ